MQRSVFDNYVKNRSDLTVQQEFIQSLCDGFVLSKIESKTRTERKKFCLRLEMCRIEWYRPMVGYEEFEGYIDYRDIKEIRVHDHTITILYGKKFCLNKLSCKSKFIFLFVAVRFIRFFLFSLIRLFNCIGETKSLFLQHQRYC